MTTAIRLALVGLVLVLLLGLGAWFYLFGPNGAAAATLVPADTLVFATIPNATRIAADYETSDLKKLVESPNAQPTLGYISNLIGPRNVALLQDFEPELSGQAFIAVTHFDPTKLAQIGFIAGLKPRPSMGNFNGFVEKLKAAYPDVIAQGKTGQGQVEGLDYQWIQGPNAPDKICVAQYRGWIITAWGEDALRDWWERLQKKSSSPSLAENPQYQKSVERVGKDSEAIFYVDYHSLLGVLQQAAPTHTVFSGSLNAQLQAIGAFAIGTRFEHGQIADHFSALIPRQAQIAMGGGTGPCAFDTMKFTGPDTRFYWASNTNWSQGWKNMQDQAALMPQVNSPVASWMNRLQGWVQSHQLDLQRNVIGALGSEFSLQMEWSADTTYPEVGLFVKLAKPDDFKSTEAAIVDSVRQAYIASAVVNELDSNGQKFATLKFIQGLPISPTITEDGPYLGLFLTENQAVRAFQRDPSIGLTNNADFRNQVGDRQAQASQLLFIDTPKLLDRGYQTALPYIPLAAMLNRTVGALVQGVKLPPDLQWLSPMGSWTLTFSPDDEGITGYSVSGVGNQGIFLFGASLGSINALQFLFHPALPQAGAMPFTIVPSPSTAPTLTNPSTNAMNPAQPPPPVSSLPPPTPALPSNDVAPPTVAPPPPAPSDAASPPAAPH